MVDLPVIKAGDQDLDDDALLGLSLDGKIVTTVKIVLVDGLVSCKSIGAETVDLSVLLSSSRTAVPAKWTPACRIPRKFSM
ncbi:hypothetical protein KIP88_43670 [Bradyrhizobium sp. SRL28]|uniref:hypothetical protein n=1 Tax=Bradyrhizobium sp. SRL28 TaxID=2836178 RepID=UPI001BDF39C1|nr:hypothetical protein [Bradyrhizobium sp. SRL28]MBT1517237.1 hypothetical protein [Bradyrhizobium sp. SRL28]